MRRFLGSVRSNAVAWLALFIALGGTSAAALGPTIDGRLIQNGSIDPIKLNARFTNGTSRAWAVVSAKGHLIAGGGKPKPAATPTPGDYEIRWGVRLKRNCSTAASVDLKYSPDTETLTTSTNSSPIAVPAGFVVAHSYGGRHSPNATFVLTFNQSGQLTPLAFDVTVTC